jgi:hypothetical protein
MKRSKNGGDVGTGVYMREGSTSRVLAADRPYGEFYNFYSVSPEYFGLHHVTVFEIPRWYPLVRSHDDKLTIHTQYIH